MACVLLLQIIIGATITSTFNSYNLSVFRDTVVAEFFAYMLARTSIASCEMSYAFENGE